MTAARRCPVRDRYPEGPGSLWVMRAPAGRLRPAAGSSCAAEWAPAAGHAAHLLAARCGAAAAGPSAVPTGRLPEPASDSACGSRGSLPQAPHTGVAARQAAHARLGTPHPACGGCYRPGSHKAPEWRLRAHLPPSPSLALPPASAPPALPPRTPPRTHFISNPPRRTLAGLTPAQGAGRGSQDPL